MEYPSTDERKFGFGFNDKAFSDRVLRLEITPNTNSECGSDMKVKKLHINSLMLAAKSPFFYKLFKNGMRESQQRDDVTLRINESEEAALMDLLNFMYGNPLSAISAPDLVDILMVADKYEVTSCMRCCIDLLLKLPMSTDSAVLCLELPSSVLVAEVIQPLIDATKKYLATYFRDFNKSQQEVAMALPIFALEVILSSDGLQVKSEDDVFEFILKWACVHHHKLEDRREILNKLLAQFICFAYMSSSKLKEVVDCPDLDYVQVSKLVLSALISKVEAPYGKHLHATFTNCGLPRRHYNRRLVKGRNRLKMGNSNTTGKQIPKENDVNFGFGFNNIDFSDRVVRLEIDLASNENHLDDTERDTGLRVETLHINSLLLAAKSPFFYKLFNNGMRESHNKADEVTLRINASEEAAVMDVLNCVYDKPLKATSAPELLDVLMAADKFEVVSCMRHCIELLLKLPMSLESALSHLELSSSIFVGEVFEPLLDAAKQRIAGHYSDFSESQQKEAMALPLSALEAVLGSDGLKVDSEDDVFDFILNWVRVNYPKLEERREILTKHLTRYICFQYMSGLKLKEVVEYPDFDYEQVSKLVINALISKNQPLLTTKRGSPRRVYNYHLIKVVSFECAQPRCVVYFNLKKEACADLYPTKRLYSPKFCVGGRYFSLFAQCYKAEQDSVYRFGLFVNMKKGSADCALNFAFAVMKKPAMEFQIQANHNYTLTATDKARGQWLFDWTDLMSDESVYFMDGILHLQARITIKN